MGRFSLMLLALLALHCGGGDRPFELQMIQLDPVQAQFSGGHCATAARLLNISGNDLQLAQLSVLKEVDGALVQTFSQEELQSIFGSFLLPSGGELSGALSLTPPTPLLPGEQFSFFLHLLTTDTSGQAAFYTASFNCLG